MCSTMNIATLFTPSCVCFLLESNGCGGASSSMYREMNGINVTQLLSINGLAINRTWTAIKSIKSGPTDLCLQNENDNKERNETAVKHFKERRFWFQYNELNKKAFQQDANRPLANRTWFIMNKFEHVGGGAKGARLGGLQYSEVQVEQVWTYGTTPHCPFRQTPLSLLRQLNSAYSAITVHSIEAQVPFF